jgi:L-glyceraldehyde 3-phosphate reductase
MGYIPSSDRYASMKYNRCGKSGLLLPAISLGLWHNFGGINIFENMRDMSKTAFDCGITHFDLANNYGPPPGSAEENFGRILKEDFHNYRDELIISTKAGYGMWPGPYGDWGSRKYLISSLDQSLKRLQLDYVDIFYHHRPDPNTPIEETMTALHDIVKQGKALYIGISNYSAEDTKKAAEFLKSLGTPLIIHQPNYSMLNRWVENGLQEVLEEEGMGSIAFSPLAQGKLTTKYLNGIPEDSRAAGASVFLNKEAITEDLLVKVKALNSIAEERGQTLAQMALSWVLRKDKVTSVLIGASKSSQILENVKIIEKLEFAEDELLRIEDILK